MNGPHSTAQSTAFAPHLSFKQRKDSSWFIYILSCLHVIILSTSNLCLYNSCCLSTCCIDPVSHCIPRQEGICVMSLCASECYVLVTTTHGSQRWNKRLYTWTIGGARGLGPTALKGGQRMGRKNIITRPLSFRHLLGHSTWLKLLRFCAVERFLGDRARRKKCHLVTLWQNHLLLSSRT